MKLPRNIGGQHLARLLTKYDYQVTRQTGSHLRLTTMQQGEHHVTIPNHNPLKIGTASSILSDVVSHLKISKSSLIEELFEK